jgi:hypothetical protein
VAIEAQIMAAIVARVQTVPDVVKINSDRIILSTSDFRDYELPAVQIWDMAQSISHERARILVNWSMSIEIVMKSLETGIVDQTTLWDLRRDIQLALWAEPNLDIPGVVHMIYTGNVTDLHLMEPYYVARIDLDVQFYDDLTGSC